MCGMGRKPPRRAASRIEKDEVPGPGLLKKWRTEQRTQQQVADLIGIDLARYNAFEHDRARPGLDWAFRIELVTKGQVPAESWARDPKALAS